MEPTKPPVKHWFILADETILSGYAQSLYINYEAGEFQTYPLHPTAVRRLPYRSSVVLTFSPDIEGKMTYDSHLHPEHPVVYSTEDEAVVALAARRAHEASVAAERQRMRELKAAATLGIEDLAGETILSARMNRNNLMLEVEGRPLFTFQVDTEEYPGTAVWSKAVNLPGIMGYPVAAVQEVWHSYGKESPEELSYLLTVKADGKYRSGLVVAVLEDGQPWDLVVEKSRLVQDPESCGPEVTEQLHRTGD